MEQVEKEYYRYESELERDDRIADKKTEYFYSHYKDDCEDCLYCSRKKIYCLYDGEGDPSEYDSCPIGKWVMPDFLGEEWNE